MTAVIRRASEDDALLLARLHAECFSPSWDEDSFCRLLQLPSTIALLAATDAATESQSFIVIQAAVGQSEILTLGTLPAARCQGLASEILKAAAEEALRANAGELFLEVSEGNAGALALYRRAGFAITGRRRAYYAGPEGAADALILRAPLPLPESR